MDFELFMKSILFFFSLLISSCVFAKICITQSIPFQNISLFPNCSIQSNFSFGNFSQMFCFTNSSQTLGVISWPSPTGPASGNLPIELSTNPVFSGSPINTSGTITILNNTPVTITVSCVYTY